LTGIFLPLNLHRNQLWGTWMLFILLDCFFIFFHGMFLQRRHDIFAKNLVPLNSFLPLIMRRLPVIKWNLIRATFFGLLDSPSVSKFFWKDDRNWFLLVTFHFLRSLESARCCMRVIQRVKCVFSKFQTYLVGRASRFLKTVLTVSTAVSYMMDEVCK
jgi:hypothetical protein